MSEREGTEGAQLRDELLTLHARILLRMPFFELVLIGAVGWIVLPEITWPVFLVWAVSALGIECVRAAMARRRLGTLAAQPPPHVHALFMALDAAAGLATGSAAPLFLAHVPILSQAVLATTLYVVAGAGVGVAVSSKGLLGLYSALILLCAAAAWSSAHPAQAPVVIALTAVYWLLLIGVSADSEKLLRRSLDIRRQRDTALRELEQRNQEIEEVAARAERAALTRARVLAAVSHDLRQPLHALSAYSAVLLANPSAQTLQEAGHNIDTLVRSLGEILGELFDLSRLSSGGYRLQHEPFALDRLVAGVCAEFAPLAADKALALIWEVAPVAVVGDASATGRIVRNLLDNAIKYTDRGEVRVTIALLAGEAILEVSDTGRGIAAEEHQRVFDEFYQIASAGTAHPQGVGLGLSIVKHLCKLMRARIELCSSPGVGTRFTVSMPGASAGNGASAVLRSIERGRESWRGARAYVVDDDPAVRTSMQVLLTLWGFEVHCAGSAAEAGVLIAKCGRPDLLLIDQRLPYAQEGAAVAARACAAYGEFPVLIITGESGESALRSAREHRYTVLQKPVPFDTLYAAVSTALQRSP